MKYLLPFLLALFIMGASIEDARKANKAYESGNYEEAITLYKKAIQEEPENAKLYFNLGNALAKNGAVDEAIRYFEQYKQMTDLPEEQAKADYNIGNIYANTKKWDQAVNSYKKAMRQQSKDLDAKHNYELALNQKKKQEQNKNQKNDQNKDKKDQEKKDNQQKNDQKNNQDQKQKQDQQKQQQDQQQQNKQDQQNEEQQQKQPQPSKISKAEAENILKALEQQEKDLLKKFKKKKTKSSNKTHEKDW